MRPESGDTHTPAVIVSAILLLVEEGSTSSVSVQQTSEQRILTIARMRAMLLRRLAIRPAPVAHPPALAMRGLAQAETTYPYDDGDA
jgi:hypothetical protein